MGLLQSQDLTHWQLWAPLIGGLILYIGLRVRVVKVEEEED